jgi:hypothetical protein
MSSLDGGQGKSTYTFSAERQRLSAFRFPPPNYTFCVEPAGGEERKVEIRISLAENIYIDLPLPLGWHGLKGKREFHNLKFKYIFGKLRKFKLHFRKQRMF